MAGSTTIGRDRGSGGRTSCASPAPRSLGRRRSDARAAVGDASAGPSGAGGEGRLCRLSGLVCGLDNVLYDATIWQRRLQTMLARSGWHASVEAIAAAWRSAFTPAVAGFGTDPDADHSFADEPRSPEAIRGIARFLRALGLPCAAADELAHASSLDGRRFENVRPFPAARDVLAGLSDDGVRLAVLGLEPAPSTGLPGAAAGDPVRRTQSLLRRLGLESRFGIVRIAPDDETALVEVLQRIAEEWRAAADALGFVGSATVALEAARRAGWRPIAFDPMHAGGLDAGGMCRGGLRVADWIELAAVVRAA